MNREERDALDEEMRELDKRDMTWKSLVLHTLDRSEETIATLGDRRWPQTAKHEGRGKIYLYETFQFKMT